MTGQLVDYESVGVEVILADDGLYGHVVRSGGVVLDECHGYADRFYAHRSGLDVAVAHLTARTDQLLTNA